MSARLSSSGTSTAVPTGLAAHAMPRKPVVVEAAADVRADVVWVGWRCKSTRPVVGAEWTAGDVSGCHCTDRLCASVVIPTDCPVSRAHPLVMRGPGGRWHARTAEDYDDPLDTLPIEEQAAILCSLAACNPDLLRRESDMADEARELASDFYHVEAHRLDDSDVERAAEAESRIRSRR